MSSTIIIDDVLPYTQSIATSLQTVFDTTWTADVASDINVYARADGVDADDATQLVSPNDYNVSFVGAELYVRVTFSVGRTLNDVVTITRLTPADRENLYTNTNFTPTMLNGDFGRLVMMAQQNELYWYQIIPRYNTSATIGYTRDLKLPILDPLYSWRMNAGGTAFEQYQGLDVTVASGIKFIIQEADSNVPNAQSLGALSTGIVKNTTTAGVGVLSISAPLTSIDGLTIADQKMLVGTGANTYSLIDLTTYSQSLLAETNLAGWQTALGIPGGGTGVYLPLAGGTMSGAIAMGANKITGVTDPTAAQDAATKAYADLMLPLAGGTMSGAIDMGNTQINNLAAPTALSDAVTLGYVTSIFQNEQLACNYSTTADMPTWTYDNGTAGVGATLTAPANGATTIDGAVPTDGQRILVNFQTTNPEWQGAYTIVQGTAGTPTVLTRATDYDEASEMQAGDTFSVVAGTLYAASQWMMTQTAAITVGTTGITFAQITGQGALLAANNLSDLLSASTARTNLGLGTIATQDANSVSITGGSITGLTSLQLGSGVTAVNIIDDDTFGTATDTNIPTSESTKAYVDAQVANAGSLSDSFLLMGG